MAEEMNKADKIQIYNEVRQWRQALTEEILDEFLDQFKTSESVHSDIPDSAEAYHFATQAMKHAVARMKHSAKIDRKPGEF